MRYVIIPPPITVKVVGQEKEFSFQDVLRDVWLNHAQFGKTSAALRSGATIEALFAKREVGDFVVLSDADYERLHAIVKEAEYNPAIARYLIPFIDAVDDAKREQPEPLKAEATASS